MKNYVVVLIIVGFHSLLFAQNDSLAWREILQFQKTMNHEFADSTESPLTSEDRQNFDSLRFFPIDLSFRLHCKFVKSSNETVFGMKTTTDRLPNYKRYAKLIFVIDSITYELSVYQNQDLIKKPGYADYLFVPFTDATNGSTSYGGGRYIDLRIPQNDSIVLDFNQAYNPYCAYNKKYSCPIPPSENDIPIEIKAGVMKFDH